MDDIKPDSQLLIYQSSSGDIKLKGELVENDVMKKFGNSEFQQKTPNFYNLNVIISVGFASGHIIPHLATQRLKEYIIKGFALNSERFKSGNSMNYFNELQEKIREIRLSECFFIRKSRIFMQQASIMTRPTKKQSSSLKSFRRNCSGQSVPHIFTGGR